MGKFPAVGEPTTLTYEASWLWAVEGEGGGVQAVERVGVGQALIVGTDPARPGEVPLGDLPGGAGQAAEGVVVAVGQPGWGPGQAAEGVGVD